MKKVRTFLFLLVGICCFCSGVRAQTPAVKLSPENWLKKKGSELVSILSEEETKTRYVKLRRIAKEVFNQQEMTRLSMGRYWRDFSADQQADLQYLFFDYFVVTYGTVSLGVEKVDIKITEKQQSGRDVLLKTQINVDFNGLVPKEIGSKAAQEKQAAGKKDETYFEILFALREIPSGYYIRDAKVEGQSVLMFLRSQMEKELQSAGYDAQAFLDAIRKKINLRYRAAEDMAKTRAGKKQSAQSSAGGQKQ
ncbi:MAG: ABC transporter substrate-binding protein [Alphaproteobacteria bacterium]